MQTLVGTEPAEEAPASKGPVYLAGARPAPRPSRMTPDRLAAASTLFVVVASTAFVIWQLHPMTLLFTNTMDAGGDNAGHIAAPYYLIHQLLTHGQVSGWDPQWFDGYPLYVFYFPLPALLVAIFNLVMPYTVAFKLTTVAGSVLMPAAAYLFGRLAGFRRPVPALMSAAMLPFLWNTSYTIDGGNLASTMAGEFSFTLSMCFGLVFLGVVARGLETGKGRGLAAVLFACTLLCHVVPGLFFAFGAVVITVARLDWRRLFFLVPAGVTGALLAGFWLVPFYFGLQYSSSMGYGRVSSIGAELFPDGYIWVLSLAVIGCLFALRLLDRYAIALGVLAGTAALAFWFLPSGQVYNERWLPFWFMTASLIAAYGIGEMIRTAGTLLEFERWHETVGALLGTAAAVVVVGIPVGVFQFVGIGNRNDMSFVPGWISWNYSGFQAKPGWNVFEGIVQLLDVEGAKYGCGRMEYEYTGPQLTDQFGSTMAFMSLPMWTNGCIDTTEGLYFESSSTTPFHFLDQSEISASPSDPVVGIPYQSYDVADGIKHDQLMGVRYLLAGSIATQGAADRDPSLQFIGSTPGVPTQSTVGNKLVTQQTAWKLYLIKDSPLVTPLSYEPVVEHMGHVAWQNLGITWYQDEADWAVPPALGGPASWPRLSAGSLEYPKQAVPVQPTTVSNIVMHDESVSFDVTRLGSPVVVKIPYFPNWHATGAEGPWEVAPNLMVVVPTSHHVTLTYGLSSEDWAGYVASGVGIVLVIMFAFLPPVMYRRRQRRGPNGELLDDGPYTGPPTADVPVLVAAPAGAYTGPPTTVFPAVDPSAPAPPSAYPYTGPPTTMFPTVEPAAPPIPYTGPPTTMFPTVDRAEPPPGTPDASEPQAMFTPATDPHGAGFTHDAGPAWAALPRSDDLTPAPDATPGEPGQAGSVPQPLFAGTPPAQVDLFQPVQMPEVETIQPVEAIQPVEVPPLPPLEPPVGLTPPPPPPPPAPAWDYGTVNWQVIARPTAPPPAGDDDADPSSEAPPEPSAEGPS